LDTSEIEGKDGVASKDLLYFVTDRREMILAHDEVLREKGWKLAYKPINFENRWSLKHVESYMNDAEVDPCQVFCRVLEAWLGYMELPSVEEYAYHTL